jgi:hypothetical protein
VILLLLLSSGTRLSTQDQAARPGGDVSVDSQARAYAAAIRAFKTPELEKRIAARRAIQRSGYCACLSGLIRRDPLEALLAYLRMQLQLEFTLPNDQLMAYFPSQYKVPQMPGVPRVAGGQNAMTVVPLYEDKALPADPWKKE